MLRCWCWCWDAPFSFSGSLVLAILLPVLLFDCINVTAKKSQGVHVHALDENSYSCSDAIFFFVKISKTQQGTQWNSRAFRHVHIQVCIYRMFYICSFFLFNVCKLTYCVFVRVCTNRILFNFRKSHYDKKSMFSFQKVQTSLWWWEYSAEKSCVCTHICSLCGNDIHVY